MAWELKMVPVPYHASESIVEAIAQRFREIEVTIERRAGEYIYSGYRCKPDRLGWRAQQHVRLKMKGAGKAESGELSEDQIPEILNGDWDEVIEHAFHFAASSEYWYTHEKDWGDDRGDYDNWDYGDYDE
jgi:hypothetical protein